MPTIEEALELALKHHQAGELERAASLYQQILKVDPNQPGALHFLGVIAHQLGRNDLAIEHIRKSIALTPLNEQYHYNLGAVYQAAGRHEEALASYQKALQLREDYVEAFNGLGNVLNAQGKLSEAVDQYNRALGLAPHYAEGHNNLAAVLQKQGNLAEAEAHLRKAMRLQPNYVDARNNLGNLQRAQGKLDEALVNFQAAVRMQPNHALAQNNLGATLQLLGKPDEAVPCHQQAVQLRPEFPEAHASFGAALLALGRLNEAEVQLREALRLRPDFPEAQNTLGLSFQARGRWADGLACFEQILQTHPVYPEAHLSRAEAWLRQGDWLRGWPEYEWRWHCYGRTPRSFTQPRWNGYPLAGKTILLYGEESTGDILQFIRYAPLLQKQGARVLVECPPDLLPLLSGCPGLGELIPQGKPLPSFDVQIPLLSLPGLMTPLPLTVPAEVPYLFAGSTRVETWRHRLAETRGLKVGLCWQGNPRERGDRQRSVPVEQLAPLAEIPGVRLVNLQRGPGIEQLARLGGRFTIWDPPGWPKDPAESWRETAGLVAALDLVITVDTTVAHLAGALGTPVWVALPLAADWRWLLNRDDSPWYPTMRLFRQTRPGGDWADVFARLADALRQRRQMMPEPAVPPPHEPQSSATGAEGADDARPGNRQES